MEANGGGGGLEDGGDHAPANGGGHGLADHALANGGDQAAAMEAGGAVGNGGLQVMVAPGGVVPAQQPDPDALYQVFLCFPAQEIARCRRVCRLWRDITSTEAFRREHQRHRYRTPMPLFFFQGPGPFRAVDIRDRVSRPVIRYSSHHEVLRIHGSCAGILLLSSGDRLYACNPCTRRWAHLPPLHVDHRIVGFYAERVSGNFECQVLYHDRQEPADCEYWIYDLGPAAAVRSIGRPGPEDEGEDDVNLDLVLANGIAPSYMIPPVYVLSCLHWPLRATRGNVNRGLLMFDAGQESFAFIPPPGNGTVVGDQLFEIDRHLAMAVLGVPSTVDIWVRSNMTELWSRRYSIRLPMYEINLNGGYHFTGRLAPGVFAVPHDDGNTSTLVQCPGILLQFDALGDVLQRYQLADYQTFLYRHAIQESLLLHPAILPMQDTDAVDGDPPFFRNQ
uniref:Uncharacterized protein n=1 Tax=Avena sativa TaxID=4498 RepID=A0ACD5WHN2_AVESA